MTDPYSIDWVFSPGPSVYMDSTRSYNLRVPGKPGVTQVTLGFDDADRVRGYLEDVIEELLRIYDRADRTAVAETWVELYRLELTEQWHKSGPEEKRSLAEYLLMTDEEYSDWVRHGR